MGCSMNPTNLNTSMERYLSAVRSSVSHSERGYTVVINTTELREMIMQNLDPLALLNLISTCRSAFASFHRYPRRFLHASIQSLGPPLSGLAIAILEARRQTPSYETSNEGPDQRQILSHGRTEAHAFVGTHVNNAFHGCSKLPDTLEDPIDALRTVAAIHDAVDTILGFLNWDYANSPAPVFSTSKEDSQVSENDEVRQALWVYHLYCVLFRPPTHHDLGDEDDEFINAQAHYFHQIWDIKGDEFVVRLGRICQDMSDLLVKLYGKSWATRFETVYKDHSERSVVISEGKSLSRGSYDQQQCCFGRDHFFLRHYSDEELHLRDRTTDFWSDPLLMFDTYTEFFKYIDYQLMMGLPYLAHIYRLSSDPTNPKLPPQKHWTTSFHAFNECELHMGPMTKFSEYQPDTCESYQLTPIEGGSKGYHLCLVFNGKDGSRYEIRPSEPVFTDQSFKPTRLGSLTACSVCKRKREKLDEDEKRAAEKGYRLHNTTRIRPRRARSRSL